jgi:DNA-binding CsgD family transcriptional regulator/PAS domain-containing protein
VTGWAFMPTGDDLLATIEAVHAAGLDSGLWPKALAAVAVTLGGSAAMFEVFDKRAACHREWYGSGVPPAAEIAYFERYVADNPRWLFMPRQRAGDISWDYQFIDERGMDEAPFYAELVAQMDLRYFLSGVLVATAEDYACISVQRSSRLGHVQQTEIGLMERLLPHVQQAFDVARRLRGAGDANKSFERAFDWIADGVAFVSAGGTVVYSNEAWQAIVRRNDIVRLRRGSIEFLAVDARTRFDKALEAVRRLRGGDQAVVALTDFPVRRAADAPPYLVSVRPLVRTVRESQSAMHAEAIVFICDPLKRAAAASPMLREIFGLTEAETSVAQALQSGVALEAYARANNVSLNTVYTHLRRVREKTGCHSVADLVRKLEELRIPLL